MRAVELYQSQIPFMRHIRKLLITIQTLFFNHRQQITLNNFTSNFCKRAVMHAYSYIELLHKCNAELDRFKMQIETSKTQIEERLKSL